MGEGDEDEHDRRMLDEIRQRMEDRKALKEAMSGRTANKNAYERCSVESR